MARTSPSEPVEVRAELAVPETVLDVLTGEVLPATVENARRVLAAARTMKRRIDAVITDATAYLVEESRLRGTKTLYYGGGKVAVRGGPKTEYDAEALVAELRAVGCPEDRIAEAVTEEVSYKTNGSVLRQLAGANPDYKAAIERASRVIEKPFSAS